MTRKLPYRNTIKLTKKFSLDRTKVYQQSIDMEPVGLWYQFLNSHLTEFGELSWGKHIYELKINTKCVYRINNVKELEKFNKKYGILYGKAKYPFINWVNVSKDYCGIEIKNYSTIKMDIRKLYGRKYIWTNLLWFSIFDFSSGCIWDLDAIKNVSYWGVLDGQNAVLDDQNA
jgi:hypothetical protein